MSKTDVKLKVKKLAPASGSKQDAEKQLVERSSSPTSIDIATTDKPGPNLPADQIVDRATENVTIRDDELVSQTEAAEAVAGEHGKVILNETLGKGDFYNTQVTKKVGRESPAFDLSKADEFVALTGGSVTGKPIDMMLLEEEEDYAEDKFEDD